VNAFEALTSGAYGNFALPSCFVDGHPAAAIITVNRQGETFTLTPALRQHHRRHGAGRP
jgi:hypothetical protein